MFEQPVAKSEKDRSKTIMIVSGLAVLVVIALIIIMTTYVRQPTPTEIAHAGLPEFDSYASNILIGALDKRTGERLNVRYARILCSVQNAGDRVLVALQLRVAVIGTGGKLIREKIINPVPNTNASLAPNQSMNIDVSLEPVPDTSEIAEMTVEVYGLKLK